MSAEKAREVEEVSDLIRRYRVIGAASLEKVRAAQLQEIRRKLGGSAHLRVTKNTVMRRAVDQCKEKPGLEGFGEHLTGPSIFMFTDLNPFRLVILLQRSRVRTTARAGDIADHDVVVPAGNTGLAPGPIISQLNAAGLATRIEGGSVWVNRDTPVAKRGDVISPVLATVLSKLGIKPVESGLAMRLAYDDGLLITEEQLQLDLEGLRRSLGEAQGHALNLSLNAAYPLRETAGLIVQRAQQEAYRMALGAGVANRETAADLLRRAHAEMLSLSSRLAMNDERAISANPATKVEKEGVEKEGR